MKASTCSILLLVAVLSFSQTQVLIFTDLTQFFSNQLCPHSSKTTSHGWITSTSGVVWSLDFKKTLQTQNMTATLHTQHYLIPQMLSQLMISMLIKHQCKAKVWKAHKLDITLPYSRVFKMLPSVPSISIRNYYFF